VRALKTRYRDEACVSACVCGCIRLRILLRIRHAFLCIPDTYPPMYSPLYLHVCTRRRISSLVLTLDAGRLACL
jgi:hypothetical protein